ncbi:MAG: HAD hydrolase family protein, partial [Candidatus Eremiobacteraeota bacterium]|nr:HAD hydrolase family protein [Candidatus Eremiobacteraeota bacterium]
MRYLALATDYDGTLADGGGVAASTIEALEALRKSSRFLIMVTGRLLEDLESVFPHVELFDSIVAENGAIAYDPAKKERVVLAPAPPPELRNLLEARGVPLEGVGHVILATREPHEKAMLDAIRELGLEMQLIFNKGAVMALPSGVNKATGLAAALATLKLSAHNTVGVGDGENDHAFLAFCECSAATANAVASLKERADIVLQLPNGAGVTALLATLLESDLRQVAPDRHRVPFATAGDAREILFDPYLQGTLLFAGTSGGGKSTAALGLIERLMERDYQVCIVDPEGDYEAFGNAIVLGDAATVPTIEEIAGVLDPPDRSAIVNLLGVEMHDRPGFVDELLARLFASRAQYGRPHWIVLDEAHHLFPRERSPAALLPRNVYSILAIAAEPQSLSPAFLESVSSVVAFGNDAVRTIERATGATLSGKIADPQASQALLWQSGAPKSAMLVEPLPPESTKRRHRRKYATGALAP